MEYQDSRCDLEYNSKRLPFPLTWSISSSECSRSSETFSHMKLTGLEDAMSWMMPMFL